MTALAIVVFLFLGAIAVLHAAWGFGLHWPAHDERSLTAMVVGKTGQSRMPDLAQCLSAAAAIFAAGLMALFLADIEQPPVPPIDVTTAGGVVALVFFGRGVAAYTPFWRGRFSQQPFARLDRLAYGPLCLLLAAAFGWMTWTRLAA